MMAKISIIVPIYNVERYLDRCMQPLLHQTLHDIEIILVDDGSPDQCPNLCDDYARRDSRIKVIHQKNGGLGFARNSGLEIATGEYVAFCDSDDFVERNMYASLYEEAKASDADVVFSNFFIETRKGQWIENKEVSERTEWRGKEIEAFMLDMVASAPYMKQERRYQMSVWHSIYRRSIIEDHHLRFLSEREVGSEDFPFQMEFMKLAKKIVFIPTALYYYCNNMSSLTAKYNTDMFDRYKKLYRVLSDILWKEDICQQRLDRFFIGYSRYCIMQLVTNKSVNNRHKLLKDLLNDGIWNDIGMRYKAHYLPLYSRIIYVLTLKKNTVALKVFCQLSLVLKKYCKK